MENIIILGPGSHMQLYWRYVSPSTVAVAEMFEICIFSVLFSFRSAPKQMSCCHCVLSNAYNQGGRILLLNKMTCLVGIGPPVGLTRLTM